MAWTQTAPTLPSGSSYTGEQSYTVSGNNWGYNAKISIARLATNQVSIRFVLDAREGSQSYAPPYAWYLGVGSDYTYNYRWGDKTIYWTGTLNAGATIQTHTAGRNNDGTQQGNFQNKTFTGPAYVTTYTISYNANGGSGAPSSQTKTYGSSITLSSTKPTRTGYTFKSWNTASDGSGTTYAAGATYSTNANLTLYAQWTINTYVISYKKGANGTGTETTVSKTYGTTIALKGAIFTRTGYTQTGWSTSDGGSKTYELGASYSANASIALYPFWTINTYAVTYNGNGSTGGSTASQTKTYGTALTLRSNGFTRTGYTFQNWNTKADGTGTSYAAGASYTANAAVTLYAIWKIITYTITYKANGPSASDQTQTKNYGASVTLKAANTFTYTNYTFQSWNTKADGTGTTYAAGATYSANAALTLYAIWKKNNIPVYINVNGQIKQVEKAYMNVNGQIKECTVYFRNGNTIYTLT